MTSPLENITKLCNLYNNPQNTFKTVHVAGTNGKGSVCTKIAKALEIEGYKVGLYTSPHIKHFHERIQINGKMISEEDLKNLTEETKEKTKNATFFEIATLLAFLYFAKNKVDIAVIETGLGGRLDATNIITPLISVITSIGYDHVELLGPSLENIAFEKAGIIKENTPVILGPDAYYPCMEQIAKNHKSPIFHNQKQFKDFDKENEETARISLEILSLKTPISKESILEGIKTIPSCRFQIHEKNKKIILDVAHNIHGLKKLYTTLQASYGQYDYRFIVGFSKGKDLKACAEFIQSKATNVHIVSGLHPRLATTEEIQKHFSLLKEIHIEKNMKEALKNALEASRKEKEVVVITGSFFIMEEALEALNN